MAAPDDKVGFDKVEIEINAHDGKLVASVWVMRDSDFLLTNSQRIHVAFECESETIAGAKDEAVMRLPAVLEEARKLAEANIGFKRRNDLHIV